MEKVDSTRQKRSDDLRIREKLETVVPMIESGYINNILLQDDFQTYQDTYKGASGYPGRIWIYDRG